MSVSLRISRRTLQIYAIAALPLAIAVIILADSFIFNLSIGFNNFDNRFKRLDELKMQDAHSEAVLSLVQPTKVDIHGSSPPPAPVVGHGKKVFRAGNRLKPEVLGLFNSTELSRRFDSRVEEFFSANQCKVQFFMTWFAPVDSYGERELLAAESLFQTNPRSCLVIVSRSMDSRKGYQKFEPLITRGYRIRAITPDLWELLKNTPGETWLTDIKNGSRDPGVIPLPQNLSNLIRLAVLYRYGGVYLDTDFIVLKDFSSLRNSIGAQSADVNGNWSRLNNALLAFDKKHPLVYKFIEEFSTTFNGNKWGHNGPYLVSRVVNSTVGEIQHTNFTVMPTTAFYPVDWIQIGRFFSRPNDTDGEKLVESTVRRLHQSTYAVHLWNRQSKKLQVEEGSVIWRLLSQHCVICSQRA
ncbi:lactosylceramide 4-alpha-galactosyltransferase [Dorcoceras hygrometricum]|uniref:Lactosylceramide 4-alpha-galactosyltransferase n=1 Tax=Dorcoceras hygrometricum TaxID=472368 RepID=A0A2Z7BYR5_9LAMI|nr:lactosylceramide 4-alpha-galactosyltransferase [Dorcoceras hygrometricum]